MATKRRSLQSLFAVSRQAIALAVAVPLVIAARLGRMARAGVRPSRRDRAEFTLMVTEKGAAWTEAWRAMTAQTMRLPRTLGLGGDRGSRRLKSKRTAATLTSVSKLHDALWGIAAKGIAPFHRRAVANAQRLTRRRRARR